MTSHARFSSPQVAHDLWPEFRSHDHAIFSPRHRQNLANRGSNCVLVESGIRIKICRVGLELSQRQFSKELGLKPWLISAIERGDVPPSYEHMRIIGSYLAERLGGTIRDFFPNYIPRDGHNTGPGSPPPNLAETRDKQMDDET